MCARAGRVLRGDCGYIKHASLGTELYGVAVNKEGHLLVVDASDESIKVFSGEGPKGTYIKTLCAGQLICPSGLAMDKDDIMYVCDKGSNVVKVFDREGNHVRDIGSGHLSSICGIAVDAEGLVFVADDYHHVVSIFNSQGQFVRDLGVREAQEQHRGSFMAL